MASLLKVDKLDPQGGTALEIGTSGDTISIPSGATLDISASTLTPPATMPASSGINFTALNATNLGSGTLPDARFPATLPAASGVNLTSLDAANLGSNTVPTARLGTGTASSTTVLYGDQTFKTEPSGFDVTSISGQTALAAQPAAGDELVLNDGGTLKKIDFSYLNQHKHFFYMRTSDPQTISWNSKTMLNLNWSHDPGGNCDLSAGEHKFTAPESGLYFFAWTLRIQLAGGNAETMSAIDKNGSTSGIGTYDGGMSFKSAYNINSNSLLSGHFIFDVAASDYFQLFGYTYQYSATADSNVGTNTCSLMGWQLD
jgi:hypothetical protein